MPATNGKMKVVLFPVGEPPRTMEIPSDLESMKSLIATAQSGDDPTMQFITLGRPVAGGVPMRILQLICDDNAHMYHEAPPANRRIGPRTIIHGPFFITAVDNVAAEGDEEELDNVGLSDEEITLVSNLPWPMVVE